MKKLILFAIVTVFALTLCNEVKAQIDPVSPTLEDSIFEEDANLNLNVAKQYFKLKKAYKGALMRFEETFAAYPQFSKMDEFLYIAGMSSYYLANNKGKQKIEEEKDEAEKEKFSPEKLLENASAYFGILIEQYPDSKFKKDSEKMLKKLNNAK